MVSIITYSSVADYLDVEGMRMAEHIHRKAFKWIFGQADYKSALLMLNSFPVPYYIQIPVLLFRANYNSANIITFSLI